MKNELTEIEMRKIMHQVLEEHIDIMYIPDLAPYILEKLGNAGFRRVGDDVMVLSKEDLQKYAKDCIIGEIAGYDILQAAFARAERWKDEARRETARDILQVLSQYGDRDEALRRHILDIADEYGVGVKGDD